MMACGPGADEAGAGHDEGKQIGWHYLVVTAVLVYFGTESAYTIVISLVVSSAAAKLADRTSAAAWHGGKCRLKLKNPFLT
ncbi:MAG: hypothetical protein ACLRZH_09455 [Ruthenibacterium lactatiformans]